jgi:hypothetical protein
MVYRPFLKVAFSLFSPPAYLISEIRRIYSSNRPQISYQQLIYLIHGIFGMSILGILQEEI